MRQWSKGIMFQKGQLKSSGFTIIELLIAIVIIGILVSVAYPNYMNSVKKTRRQEAKRTLLEASQMMENFYSMNINYTGAVSGSVLTIFNVNDEFDEYYGLTATATATRYTLRAIPKNTQIDDECGTMTIAQSGATTADKTGCW